MKKIWFVLGSLILLMVIGVAFSTKQDDMQYRRFLMQDTTVEGKPGVLLVALGMRLPALAWPSTWMAQSKSTMRPRPAPRNY